MGRKREKREKGRINNIPLSLGGEKKKKRRGRKNWGKRSPVIEKGGQFLLYQSLYSCGKKRGRRHRV